MTFAAKEMVRKAVAEGRYDLLYVMVPADDGGQTYEMKCKICGEFGNILANKFSHAKVAQLISKRNFCFGVYGNEFYRWLVRACVRRFSLDELTTCRSRCV